MSTKPLRWFLLLLALAVGTYVFVTKRTDSAIELGGYGTANESAAQLSVLADEYLEWFAQNHPSIAAGNGLHQHDGTLEDYSDEAVASQVEWLKAFGVRLAAVPRAQLPPDERVDHRILQGLADAWLLELDGMKNHARNPMIYASAIADGVHNLMTMESAPAATRMERVRGKLQGIPRLLDAARRHLVNPPRVLVDRGITMFEGASAMLATDLAQAFPDSLGESRTLMLNEAAAAKKSIDDFITYLRSDLLPRSNGPIALGREYVEARYRAEELFDESTDTLLAMGMRQLAREQELFKAKAAEIDPSRPMLEVWQGVRMNHPKRGEVVEATRAAVAELQTFVTTARIARVPEGESVIVEASRPFDLGLASMHASPPLEPVPVASIYYITDANASWPLQQQNAWLERFNKASLTITSAHEAMPGHFVHSLYMRQTPGKIRRIWIGLNPFPQPSSGQDGWAHYAEQMVIEQGFRKDDPSYALAQLSESMTRICRLIAGLQVHTGTWTVDDAAAFFEKEAHVPAPAARQEAVRVVYDPTNGGYFLGKRAMLKLRADTREIDGSTFDLLTFHERVMRNGIAPLWAHRVLILGDSSTKVLPVGEQAKTL